MSYFQQLMGVLADGGGGRTGVERAISPFNRLAISTVAGSGSYSTRVAFRDHHIIGSSDVDGVRMLLNNWYCTSSNTVVNGASPLTFSNCHFEYVPANATTPIAFDGGASSRVLATTDADIKSDVILPSAFGLAKFDVGASFYFRGFLDIPVSGSMPLAGNGDSSNTQFRAFDPAATSCTNIAAAGTLAFTGTTPSNPGRFPLIAIGTFVSGDPIVPLGVGDSNMNGYNDTAGPAAQLGYGWFSRALRGSLTNALGGINAAVGGTQYTLWTSGNAAKLDALVKYCNVSVYAYGTNSFTTEANSTALTNAVIAGDRTVWTRIRGQAVATAGARAFRILGCLLPPRSTFSPNDSNQVQYGVRWEVGGDVDVFHAARAADVGVAGRLDALYDPSPVLRQTPGDTSSLGYHRWVIGTSHEGTHLNSNGHSANAAAARPSIDAL